jgi:hypothetical protein
MATSEISAILSAESLTASWRLRAVQETSSGGLPIHALAGETGSPQPRSATSMRPSSSCFVGIVSEGRDSRGLLPAFDTGHKRDRPRTRADTCDSASGSATGRSSLPLPPWAHRANAVNGATQRASEVEGAHPPEGAAYGPAPGRLSIAARTGVKHLHRRLSGSPGGRTRRGRTVGGCAVGRELRTSAITISSAHDARTRRCCQDPLPGAGRFVERRWPPHDNRNA